VTESISSVSPRLKARIAGAFYVLAVLTAVCGEAFLHGRLAFAVGLIAVACFVVVTLLLYLLFKRVDRVLASFAALSNLVGLSLEALEFHLHGVNVALIFHGLYCILIGLLMFRSALLPRALGILMTIGGFAWLTDLSIPFTNQLAPYNVGVGFLGEGLPMLWLLIIGVTARTEQDRATEQRT
jgi:uncharacterized protein DUF4386